MSLWTIGIDEVGRGPIAGPVTICALAIPARNQRSLRGFLKFTRAGDLKDSKRMSQAEREACAASIKQAAKARASIFFSVSHVTPKVLDRLGIVGAVRLAVRRSLAKLSIEPSNAHVLLDGSLLAPEAFRHQRTIVRGDQRVPIIALASVIAKVARDKRMRNLSKRYPGYSFDKHVGYGTSEHYRAIRRLGVCDIHRRSFLRKFSG